MKNILLKSLTAILGVESESYNTKRMNRFIKTYVNKLGLRWKEINGNLYVTKGNVDTYPCVVAHTDTVHKILPPNAYHVKRHDDFLYAIDARDLTRTGIGGDDKVGIFVALQALEQCDNIKVAFFRDEEVGCVGSSHADMKFFDDVEFVLQCDRRGMGEITRSIMGREMFDDSFAIAISHLLDKYRREEVDGGMTDVWQLADNGLKVCCANIACGYYQPHTDDEYVSISDIQDTLDFVLEIIDTVGGNKWEIERKTSYGKYYDSDWGGWSYSPTHGWHRDGDDEIPSDEFWIYDENTAKYVNDFGLTRDEVKDIEHALTLCKCPECDAYELGYDSYNSMAYCHCCHKYSDVTDIEDFMSLLDGNDSTLEEDNLEEEERQEDRIIKNKFD